MLVLNYLIMNIFVRGVLRVGLCRLLKLFGNLKKMFIKIKDSM